MTDFLAVVIGVVLGVLASVPVAMVIAASTTHGPARPRARRADLPALDVPYVALPEHENSVIIWEVTP